MKEGAVRTMASLADPTPVAGQGSARVVTKNDPQAVTINPNAASVNARAATGPITDRATTRPTSRATRTTARAKLAEVEGAPTSCAQSPVGAGNWPAR